MKEDFEEVEKRAAACRLTVPELLEKAGVSSIRYWRAKNNKHVRRDSNVVVLRQIESVLAEVEKAA